MVKFKQNHSRDLLLNPSPFAENKKAMQCEWSSGEFVTLALNTPEFMMNYFTASLHWSYLISTKKDGGLDKQGGTDTKLALGISRPNEGIIKLKDN